MADFRHKFLSFLFLTAIGGIIFFGVQNSVYADPITAPSSAGPPTPPACSDPSPTRAPRLFRIETTDNSAKLYFSPVTGPISYYSIIYGYSNSDYRFGSIFNQSSSDGVLSHTVSGLVPGTTYYFYVAGGNGCSAILWSNSLHATTAKSGNTNLIFTAWEQIQNTVMQWIH